MSKTDKLIELIEEQNRLIRRAQERARPIMYSDWDVRCSKCDSPCMIDSRGGSVSHILMCKCDEADARAWSR